MKDEEALAREAAEAEAEAAAEAAEWLPTAEEQEGSGGPDSDPDLPILGDVSLTIDLKLGLLPLTPTLAIDAAADERAAEPPRRTGVVVAEPEALLVLSGDGLLRVRLAAARTGSIC